MKELEKLNGPYLMIDGQQVGTHHCTVLVIGSGAAGLAAALRLSEAGVHDVLFITEDRFAGTSRNAGSDKQTYYKLTLAGNEPDSVGQMAETLAGGGCMDGDLARIEAALSASCFHFLCDLGVPFPKNKYGEAVGYKTDHDLLSRGTSAGPLTSRFMVERLEAALSGTDVALLDHHQVVRILTDPESHAVWGALSLYIDCVRDFAGHGCYLPRYTLVLTSYIVFAVGGPAMVYADSVYPESQMGGTGLALEAGAVAVNLTEWQYGLASVHPRWNVSGSYQQVLPRYVSTEQSGQDEKDFLSEWIRDRKRRLSLIFQKGYQWPFDVRRIEGSSLIDLLVYYETVLLNRRVFLDFRSNDEGLPFSPDSLDEESKEYLSRAGAAADQPWQRLMKMNEPAYDFYLKNGIDLSKQPLEIRLCAQHHNGGLLVDENWQSNIRGLYPIGEVSGTHGVYRPGGSALNSGQVGALRATGHIVRSINQSPPKAAIRTDLLKQIRHLPTGIPGKVKKQQIQASFCSAAQMMSRIAGPVRDIGQLMPFSERLETLWQESQEWLVLADPESLPLAFRYRELLLVQRFLAEAMTDYVKRGGSSRGSALYLCQNGRLPEKNLPDIFKSRLDGHTFTSSVQEARLEKPGQAGSRICINFRPVRPIPQPDESFEQVWRTFRMQSQKELYR